MAMFPISLSDPKPPQFLHFSSPFISLYWVNIDISNLVHKLTVTSPSIRRTKCPWKGRGYVTWPIFTARGYAKRGICRRRVSACLSVCLSVTLRYCIKMAKCRITQTTPHDSPMILVFWGRMHDAVLSASPRLKSSYDRLATKPRCMTPT